nr:choice-of-anchor L domain-containing protein [Bacteroidota bacterium]
MKNNYLLFCAFFLYLFGNAQPYITTSTTQFTQEELVTQVLINSPCAIVENVVGITGINFGSLNGIGYFENTNPEFPINDGVILMTAGVNQAPGPNGNPQDAGNWPGDAQLFNYIQSLGIDPGLTSYNDASILEFDFKPLTDSISFNFVFASNEYGIFQCDYSDAFAFFLTNEDTNEVTNLAIVPGTSDPISVITIRDQLYNSSCGSVNPEFFDKYYGTPNGLPNVQSPINFNGHTVLMQAWSYVEPNTQYRMKLVIADRNDSSFNSAVFIQGGSFFIGGTDLGEDLTIANGNAPCDDEEVILTVNTSQGSIITWFFNGDIIPGENGQTLLVTEPGLYGVEIVNPDAPDCFITDEILIEFKTTAIIDLGDDILGCEAIFVELDATPENLDDLGGATYEWFFNGVLIPGENNATLEVTEYGEYTVEVTTDLGCVTTDSISVDISDFTVDLGEDVFLCEN